MKKYNINDVNIIVKKGYNTNDRNRFFIRIILDNLNSQLKIDNKLSFEESKDRDTAFEKIKRSDARKFYRNYVSFL